MRYDRVGSEICVERACCTPYKKSVRVRNVYKGGKQCITAAQQSKAGLANSLKSHRDPGLVDPEEQLCSDYGL